MEINTMDEQSKKWMTPFFVIWIGQLFSIFGSNLVQFALVWWLTQRTGSATVLATATLVAMLPQILLGPFVGTLVDRWNRRVVMMVADSSIAFVSLIMFFLFLNGTAQVWHVYLVMLIRSLGGTFHAPAMQASTTLMVPQKHLARIAGLNQTFINGILNIISSPLAALLLSLFPIQGILLIDVGTACLAVFPLFFIFIPQPVRKDALLGARGISSTYWQDLKAGFRYVLGWPGLLAIMAISTIVNFLFSPAFSLMPLLVTNYFGGGALQYGMMDSAWGVGVVAGGLVLSAWGGFRRKIVTSMVGLMGMAVGIGIIGILPASGFALAVAALVLSGFMNPITNGPLIALFQVKIDPEMQGRVFSLLGSAGAAMSPLSLAVAGPVGDALGIQVWYIVAGIVSFLIGLVALLIPAIRHMEDDVQHDPVVALTSPQRIDISAG